MADTKQQQRLLFIGNSYTSSNHLAKLTQHVLEAGIPDWKGSVVVQSHAPPGESFRGHLSVLQGRHPKQGTQHGLYRSLISPNTTTDADANQHKVSWTWVILQDQSQIPAFCQLSNTNIFGPSLTAVQVIQDLVAAHHPHAKTLFLMTWGRRDRDKANPQLFPDFPTMQALLTEGYREYRDATSTPERPTYIAPVGLVFRTIYNDCKMANGLGGSSLFHQLYVRDGSHPSLAGSYVAAMTIFATITGQEAKDVAWTPAELDPEIAVRLRDAVSRTIQETTENNTIHYPWQG